jgi:hypothetical protein
MRTSDIQSADLRVDVYLSVVAATVGCAHTSYRVSNPTSQALFLKGDDDFALTRFVGIGPGP